MIQPPKTVKDLSKTLAVSLPKELPLQFDLHNQQHAYRLLKDYHKRVTYQSANARVKAGLELARDAKLREREAYEN